MRSLQISELSLHSQQKEDQRKDRSQEILQEMPPAHGAQRIEIIPIGGKLGVSVNGKPRASKSRTRGSIPLTPAKIIKK